MTVRDMIERFQARLEDYQTAFWNDQRAIALINTYKDKLAQEFNVSRCQQYYTFDSVEGQQRYEVPVTFVANEFLFYDSSYANEIVIKVGPSDIYNRYSPVTTEGMPRIGYIWGVSGRRELTIYPTFNQDGLTVEWWYYGWPPNVSEDNDEPLLPIEWHPSIVEGMISQAKSDDKMMSYGDMLLLWKDEVLKLKKLDCTKELMTTGGQIGSVDAHFPAIQGAQSEDIRASWSGGSVT